MKGPLDALSINHWDSYNAKVYTDEYELAHSTAVIILLLASLTYCVM